MKRLVSLALVMLLIVLASLYGLAGNAAAADKATGTTIRLAEYNGTVTVKTASGKTVTPRTDLRLYNGYTIQTSRSSDAYLSLDDTKAIKLDAATKVEVKKSGKQLEISIKSGKLFFNVEKPLADDEGLSIRNFSKVTGVRGSFGWVGTEVMGMIHGHATISHLDTDGNVHVLEVTSGELVYAVEPTEQGSAEKRVMANDDVPGVAAQALKEDPELAKLVDEDVPNLDVDEIIDQADEKTKQEDEELGKTEEVVQEEISQLDEEIGTVTQTTSTVDQVFEEPEPEPEPDDSQQTQPSQPKDTYHSVTFYADGEVWYSTSVLDGAPIDTSSMTDSPSKDGAYFKGWTTDPDGKNEYQWETIDNEGNVTETPVTSDLSLYALFCVTVHFDTNSSTASSVNDADVPYNTPVDKPSDPTDGSNVFEGWYKDFALTEPYDFSTPVTEELRLYAKWGTSSSGNNNQPTIDPGDISIPYYNSTSDYNIDKSSEGWTLVASYTDDNGEYFLSQLSLTIKSDYALYDGRFEFYESENAKSVSVAQSSSSADSTGTTLFFDTTGFRSDATTDSYVNCSINVMLSGGNINDYSSFTDWPSDSTVAVMFDVNENSTSFSGMIPQGRNVFLRSTQTSGDATLEFETLEVAGTLTIANRLTLASYGQNAQLQVDSTGVLNILGELQINTGGELMNEGTVEQGGSLVIYGTMVNNGQYSLNSQTSVIGTFENNGNIDIGPSCSMIVGDAGTLINNSGASINGTGTLEAFGEYTNNGDVSDSLNVITN